MRRNRTTPRLAALVVRILLWAAPLSACAAPPPPPGPVPLPRLATLDPTPPGAVGMDPALGATLDSVVQAGIAAGAAPGAAVAVARWSRLVKLRGYGHTGAEPGDPQVTDSTLYDLASLTKVVATTTAAMILEDATSQ